MKTYIVRKEIFVRRPLDDVFEFFARPENLPLITPPWLGLRILTPSPVLMKEGTIIDYTIRLMGIPVRWQSIISGYDPPREFVDEQLRGPYASWRHAHTFTETDAGTLIGDEVEYGMPYGLIGRIVRNIAVHRQLEAIFTYRAGVIERLFGSSELAGQHVSFSMNDTHQGRNSKE